MNPAVIILCIFGSLALIGLLVILIILWIGAGESDVNGEKERDAGYTDEEIYQMERLLYPPALSRAERELIHQRGLPNHTAQPCAR